MRWILVLLSLLPATVPLIAPAVTPRLLDRQSALYFEDAVEARPIAAVAAELVRAEDPRRVRLRLAVAAIGVGVDPLPGITGRPGANLRTAEELDRLLREDALQLVTRVDGASRNVGECIAIDWGQVPVRRIGVDGRIDFDAVTAERWPVRVVFELEVSVEGSTWCYLEADAVPRLAVQIVGERITAIESRGAEPRR